METFEMVSIPLIGIFGTIALLAIADEFLPCRMTKERKRRLREYYRKYTEWKAEDRRRELMGKDELSPPAGYPYF